MLTVARPDPKVGEVSAASAAESTSPYPPQCRQSAAAPLAPFLGFYSCSLNLTLRWTIFINYNAKILLKKHMKLLKTYKIVNVTFPERAKRLL